jgi:hypothetical protein
VKDEVYRVIAVGDESEYRQSGYRNATGLYNSLAGARGQVGREKRDAERRRENLRAWAERRGEPVTLSPIPEFKIQKSALVWEDAE